MQIQHNVSLQPYNTFGIDTKANLFTIVKSEADIVLLANSEEFKSNSTLMLGGGSNILLTKDYNGLVIKNEIDGISIISEDDTKIKLAVGSGVNWHQFVLYCIDHNWCGVENLSLIPGCVGAAPIQNIGAYGVEVKDAITGVRFYNIEKKCFEDYNNEDCKFGYRESVFKKDLKNNFFITTVYFELKKQAEINISYGAIKTELEKNNITNPTIKDVSNAVIAIRSSKLPDPKLIGNAGSFFKNPTISIVHFEKLKLNFPNIVGYPNKDNTTIKIAAGWLIESCGLKGIRVGNTGCHQLQALVLVNYGNATGNEIFNYSEAVIQQVKSKFDISLEREVNII
jgi:UDP-N-acetylmuramate dehydrogenase